MPITKDLNGALLLELRQAAPELFVASGVTVPDSPLAWLSPRYRASPRSVFPSLDDDLVEVGFAAKVEVPALS